MKAGAALMAGAAILSACAGREAALPRPVEPAAPASIVAPAVEAAPVPVPVDVPAPAVAPPSYLPAGVHERQIDVDGTLRRWTIVVPATPEGSAPAGLVVVLHGVGGLGADMRSAGFEPLAGAAGAVMAYPDGLGGAWNDGRPGADPVVPGVNVDDVRFLRLLIDETGARTGTDARRVAVVGFSNGAVMAGRVACDLADRVVAVGLVAGTVGQGFQQSCRPARSVAVMMVAGSSDATVPYAGGKVANWGTKRRGFVAGVEETFTFWQGQNGCTAAPILGGTAAVGEERGADCRTPVVRYRITGGGHEWYRAPRFETTGMLWDFVSRRFATPDSPALR